MAQYGIHPNAQALIDAHQASVDPAVTRASLTQIDPEATAEAEEDFEATAGKLELGDDDKLLAVAVRGNALVGVVESADGSVRKVVGPWNDRYEAPTVSADVATRRATAERDARVAQETARLRSEADARIAEARAEEEARVAEEVAKIREQADADLEATVKEMDEDDGSESESSTPKPTRRSASSAKSQAPSPPDGDT